MYIAKKECRRLREERAKFVEAERIKKLEEEKLKKQMNAKKAREEAERLHLQRLDQMRLDDEAKEKIAKEQMQAKRAHIEDAEKRRNQDVDDSKMVDEVFGFLPGDSDGGGPGGGGGGGSALGHSHEGAESKRVNKAESGPSLFRDLEDKRQQVGGESESAECDLSVICNGPFSMMRMMDDDGDNQGRCRCKFLFFHSQSRPRSLRTKRRSLVLPSRPNRIPPTTFPNTNSQNSRRLTSKVTLPPLSFDGL